MTAYFTAYFFLCVSLQPVVMSAVDAAAAAAAVAAAHSTFEMEPEICAVGGRGVILPFHQSEQTWDVGPRAFIYLLMLAWCFLGVGIISDVFMGAIDVVTSKRKTIPLANGQEISVKVWNDTVANLSLMALGSSAPEIMLNVIEIVCRNFFSGDLGPSTIVGSAAFNLMVIIAVCVVVIPEGDSRTIESVEPFLVTAFFSIFAYIWMVIILSVSTPNVVTIPEAVITLLFFPLLLIVAYLADIGKFTCGGETEEDEEDENVEFIKQKVAEAGFELTTDETRMLARLKTAEFGGAKSRAAAKVDASPLKNQGMAKQDLQIEKFGSDEDLVDNARVMFLYKTVNGNNMSADDGDYIPCEEGSGCIMPGEPYGEITIKRKPGMPGADSNGKSKKGGTDARNFFYVEIIQAMKMPGAPAGPGGGRRSMTVKPGDENDMEKHGVHIHLSETTGRTQVAVAEDMFGAGELRMDNNEVSVPYPDRDTFTRVKVKRTGGSDGEISCRFECQEDTAKSPHDYYAVEGELIFPSGCVEKVIEVPVMRKIDPRSQDTFTVSIEGRPGDERRVDERQALSTVTIFSEEDKGIANSSKVLKALDTAYFVADTVNNSRVMQNDWADQFKEALKVETADEEQATAADWTMHILALPWKVLFAFTPPPSYCGGWLAFCVALIFIGAVTVFIGDLATLVGCVMKVNGSITAITIVALGTSLPDTFASKTSAVEDPSADAAIGNVTGSNSVNVFLGLGLPWVIGSFYWQAKGRTPEWNFRYGNLSFASDYPNAALVVLAGDLSFSVGVFTLCACCTLSVIWYRRQALQAELGGPVGVKTNTSIFLVLLWIFYVSMASWKVIAGEVAIGQCVMAVLIGILCVLLGMMIVAGGINFVSFSKESRRSEMKDVMESVLLERDDRRAEEAEKQEKLKAKEAKTQKAVENGAGSSLNSPRPKVYKGKAEIILAQAADLADALADRAPDGLAKLRQHCQALDSACSTLEREEGGGKVPSSSPRPGPAQQIQIENPSARWGQDDMIEMGTMNNNEPIKQANQLSPDGLAYDGADTGLDGVDEEGRRQSKTPKLAKRRLKKSTAPNTSKIIGSDVQGAGTDMQENVNEEREDLLDSLEKDPAPQAPASY